MPCAEHSSVFTPCMAEWQLKLANLAGLTSEQKEDAELAIPSLYTTTKERDFFLRGSDAEACRLVSKLLAKGKRATRGLPLRPMEQA